MESNHAIADLVEAARPSIVSVHQTVTQQDVFGNDVSGQAAGTGFVLSADGYVVTNSHVVESGDDTTVEFADGTIENAEVVAADPSHDLAVLRVDRTDLQPLAVGDSDELRLGDSLIAIGYALDLNGEPSVTAGILSARDRSITVPGGDRLVHLLQTDAAINPGNSGGPLLNAVGEVIGINTAVAGQAQNIGFAIAISPAETLIGELRNGSVPDRALLGVSTQPATGDAARGAEVVEVSDGSAADDAGIEIGDLITSVSGVVVDGPDALGIEIASHQPGDTISLSLLRDGEQIALDATLGTRPSADVG